MTAEKRRCSHQRTCFLIVHFQEKLEIGCLFLAEQVYLLPAHHAERTRADKKHICRGERGFRLHKGIFRSKLIALCYQRVAAEECYILAVNLMVCQLAAPVIVIIHAGHIVMHKR